MTNQGNARSRGREVPLDHLRPGERQRSADAAARDADASPNAQPAEPRSPGGAEEKAVRGKATRSPAEVATRPHLEGSEQGPM